jgi:hypothetical protein
MDEKYVNQVYDYLVEKCPSYNIYLRNSIPREYFEKYSISEHSISYDIMMIDSTDNMCAVVTCKNYNDRQVEFKDLKYFHKLLYTAKPELKGIVFFSNQIMKLMSPDNRNLDNIKRWSIASIKLPYVEPNDDYPYILK